jgi:hypothetical protein
MLRLSEVTGRGRAGIVGVPHLVVKFRDRSENSTGLAVSKVSPVFVEEAFDDPRLSKVAGPKDNGSIRVANFLVQSSKGSGLIVRPELQEVGLCAALASSFHPVYDFS